MDTFPMESDPLLLKADGTAYSGWLLFLDEFNSAAQATQAAAYKLVLDRQVGQKHLHKNVAILCAGNKETDGAIVEPMSTAMQSRLVHLELVYDAPEWLDWAATMQFNSAITSYIGWKPDAGYAFSADHTDKTYASPRTWEFANRIMSVMPLSSPVFLQTLAGALSEGIAREFIAYTKIQDKLPKLNQIIAAPDSLKLPTDLSTLWALSGMLASNMDNSNASPLLQFIARLPVELQVFCLRDATRRTPELKKSPALLNWVVNAGVELF